MLASLQCKKLGNSAGGNVLRKIVVPSSLCLLGGGAELPQSFEFFHLSTRCHHWWRRCIAKQYHMHAAEGSIIRPAAVNGPRSNYCVTSPVHRLFLQLPTYFFLQTAIQTKSNSQLDSPGDITAAGGTPNCCKVAARTQSLGPRRRRRRSTSMSDMRLFIYRNEAGSEGKVRATA
jgi:hypothetical protein